MTKRVRIEKALERLKNFSYFVGFNFHNGLRNTRQNQIDTEKLKQAAREFVRAEEETKGETR